MNQKAKRDFITNTLYTVIIISLVLLSFYVVLRYLFPFVIGGFIACFVQKPSCFLGEKLGCKSGVAAAILSAFLYLIFGFLLVFLVYRALKFSVGFVDLIPAFFEKLGAAFQQIQARFLGAFSPENQNFSITLNTLINGALTEVSQKAGSFISNLAGSVAKNLPSFFINSIVTLVATCFIAKDYEQLSRFVKNLFGSQLTQKAVKIKNILIGSVLKLFKGYLILSLIAFLELYIGFWLIGVKHAFALAAVIAVVDLFPIIGTGTVLVPWAVISALVGDISLAVALGVLYAITILVRNFLEPKIIGMQIGINSLFTLIFMFVGLKIMGVIGMLLFPIIFIVTIKYYKNEMTQGLSV